MSCNYLDESGDRKEKEEESVSLLWSDPISGAKIIQHLYIMDNI